MLVPPDEAQRATWAETLLFRTVTKKGASRAWDHNSYRKAWANAVDGVLEKYPEARGMILRDLRKVFRTRLTDARVPEPTIQILMGHARGVSAGYHKPDAAQLREAILSIPVPPAPATEAAQVASGVAVSSVQCGQ